MGLIDDIKSRLDIVDVIGRDVELRKAGGLRKGLCPFHVEKTASFVVYPDSQRFKCFGCGVAGDVFDFKQKMEGWDLNTAIRELAREAGVTVRPLTVEQQRDVIRTREKETVFAIAAQWMADNLATWDEDGYAIGEASLGLLYARFRGWDDETIRSAGLGYFGKDWDALRKALLDGGVELACPAAVALVGFRGDVSAWGKRFSIAVQAEWVKAGKVPAMPPELLIYPHVLGGRVVYLSGRTVPDVDGSVDDRPKSWNPRIDLVGDKVPFFNALWGQRRDGKSAFKYSVIVEGQGCAISLAQFGVPAVALAGVR